MKDCLVEFARYEGRQTESAVSLQRIPAGPERIAIARTSNRSAIFITSGTFPEMVYLHDLTRRVALYGGYDPTTWRRDVTKTTLISGSLPERLPLVVVGIRQRTTIQLVTVSSSQVRSDGDSYGVLGFDSPGLVLDHDTIMSLPGRAGSPGAAGATGAAGEAGQIVTPGAGATYVGGVAHPGGAGGARGDGSPGGPGAHGEALVADSSGLIGGAGGPGGLGGNASLTVGGAGSSGDFGLPGAEGVGGVAS